MSNEIRSNIPGRITAPAEMLEPAVAELLRRIPDTWQAYRPDDLTETQSQALFLLTAAGMVERRERLRLRMVNHPVVAEATITVTGEYGDVEALEPIAAQLWADWQDSFHKWKEGDTPNVASLHCERLEPSEWRLTDQGVAARKSLADGEQNVVFDFVLKRGFFDGQPRLVNGRVCRREPVRGKGALVKMTKMKGEPVTPGTVNIGNWDKGGEAFAKAFTGLFEAMLAPTSPRSTCLLPSPPGPVVTANTCITATPGQSVTLPANSARTSTYAATAAKSSTRAAFTPTRIACTSGPTVWPPGRSPWRPCQTPSTNA